MNKKLLASAVIAAVAASPAAFAESTVYGKMHTSVDAIDYDNGRDNREVNNRSSRLGFKGSEDLGNGLKAIYQIEFGIRSDGGQEQVTGDGHTSLRNTFVGLASDWGTFLVGRHDTPMKMAFYASGNERLGDSAIDLNRGFDNDQVDSTRSACSRNFAPTTRSPTCRRTSAASPLLRLSSRVSNRATSDCPYHDYCGQEKRPRRHR